MPTMYQKAVRNTVHRHLTETPGFAQSLSTVLDRINSGAYPRWFVDAVVQRPGANRDIYDAFSVGWMDAVHQLGWIGIKLINMTRGAFPDRMAEENNSHLSRLPEPFQAVFEGGAGHCDGQLSWDAPKPFGMWDCREAEAAPATVPLEVGATSYGRTIFHIIEEGGVARWPYDSSRLVIFRLMVSPDLIRPHRDVPPFQPKESKPSSPVRRPSTREPVLLSDGTDVSDLAQWRKDRRKSRQ